jgi:AcrR family transcriptional regulator
MASVALPERRSGSPTRRDPVRRQELLQVAARVFAQSGFAATSMDEIAAAAGVSKLVAYRHFETKEGLYRAVLEQVFQRQVELFVTYLAEGLQAGGATRALLDVAREWPDGFRLLWRHAVREPQFADYARELRDTAVTAAREVVEPVLAPNFTEWAAQTLFDHLVDAVLNWLDHGDARLDDQFVSTEAAALLATVAAWVRVHPADSGTSRDERA